MFNLDYLRFSFLKKKNIRPVKGENPDFLIIYYDFLQSKADRPFFAALSAL
ncbi:MAG: hypothetical protein LBC53_05975 [Spirochaetaceae bacterium]|nr:hypothetical protein [Spirochaetaceae bacterium]